MPRVSSYIILLALFWPSPARAAAAPASAVLIVADGLGWGHLQTWLELRRLENRPPRLAALWEKGRLGTMTLRPLDAVVAESAGGASMLSTGEPSANLALAVSKNGARTPLLLEKARAAGKATGLITLGRLTHAVPAAFLVHAVSRDPEADVAPLILKGPAQLLMAGGRDAFDLQAARAAGWKTLEQPQDLTGAQSLPVLGLFAPDYFPYALDRSTEVPTLEAMTRTALKTLSTQPNGFVLILDARLIDESSHNNDAAAMLAELDALDAAVGAVLDARTPDTLVVLTSPHDTGGPAVVSRANPLAWGDPEGLLSVRAQTGSGRRVLARLWERERSGKTVDAPAVREAARGIIPALVALDDAALEPVARAFYEGPKSRPFAHSPALQEIARALEIPYGIRWLTGAHSNAPVPLFALGPGQERFAGWLSAEEAGRALSSALGL